MLAFATISNPRTRHMAYRVVQEISGALRDQFDLTLNDEKTSIEPDVLSAAFRPWSREAAKSIAIQKVTDDAVKISGRAMKSALKLLTTSNTMFQKSQVD